MEIGGTLAVLLTIIICTPGCEADPCQPSVKASRRTLSITEGAKAVMHCDVEHCGEAHWRGGWGQVIEPFVFLQPTPRHKLYNRTISANSATLFLEILHTNLSDAGPYQCRVNINNITMNGHMTTLNITAAAAGGEVRSRVAVYVGVCILLISVLTCFLSPACRKCCRPRNPPEEHPAAPGTARLKGEVREFTASWRHRGGLRLRSAQQPWDHSQTGTPRESSSYGILLPPIPTETVPPKKGGPVIE